MNLNWNVSTAWVYSTRNAWRFLLMLAVGSCVICSIRHNALAQLPGGYIGISPSEAAGVLRRGNEDPSKPLVSREDYSFRKSGGRFWDLRPFASLPPGSLPPYLATNWILITQDTVLQVTPDGLLLNDWPTIATRYIFVKNHPDARKLKDNATLRGAFLARYTGPYQYQGMGGAYRTVDGYDFGTIPTQEEIRAYLNDLLQRQEVRAQEIKEARAKQAAEMEPRVIAWQLQQATNGMKSAQCAVGKRYLAGNGLVCDTNLARYWLEKSAAQGDVEAKAALDRLNKKN